MATLQAVFSVSSIRMGRRFEYKVVSFCFKDEQKALNELGEEGWELVCSYCLGLYLIFKREKEENGKI